MELEVEQKAFLPLLAAASHIATPRGGLAALGGVLLRWGEGRCVLSATNLDLAVEVSLPCGGGEGGEVVAPARLLFEIVGAAPEGSLRCRLEEGGTTFTVCWERGEARLRTLPREDFPVVSFDLPGGAATVAAQTLTDAVAQVARAASRDETRPLLTGIKVGVSGGKVELVATDSYRLAARTVEGAGVSAGELEVTVPAGALGELGRLIGQGEGTVSMAKVDHRAVFRAGEVALSSRLLEGQFPDYTQLLPEEPPVVLALARASLLAVVRRIGLVAARNTPVALTLDGEGLLVSTRAPDIGEAEERLPIPYTGAPLTIGFNPSYLRDALEAAGAEQITLKLTNAVRPGVLEAQEADGNLLYLVMPVRMEE